MDDDEDSREITRVALEAGGAAATCVAAAREALLEVQRAVPSVAVSDITMPGENGHAARLTSR